jgi:predicted amidophosphoribosyltransferase
MTDASVTTRGALDDVMPTEAEPLCDRCSASFRAPDDTLCGECRAEIDAGFADLPGAEL